MANAPVRKNVLVHLGPHKTGSTSIQRALAAAPEHLNKAGICFLQNPETHRVALELANEHFERAENGLSQISKNISTAPTDTVILSQEDFCGALIGRSTRRRIYPKLTKNLRILMRSLRPHKVRFVFFVRDEKDWLRSSYHQHLKYRTKFHSFEDFAAYYGSDFSWADKLKKPAEVFGSNFITLQYEKKLSSGINRLLALSAQDCTQEIAIPGPELANPSPTPDEISLLERINELSEFKATAWFSKSLILGRHAPDPTKERRPAPWPPACSNAKNSALPALSQRIKNRVQKQSAEDILPSPEVDLSELAAARLPREVAMPELDRWNIGNQSEILKYHLRGKSKLNFLNALTISYLRRDTPCTDRARNLFHRIWREQGAVLLNELSTRWLISTLQTFLDHGENEAQRLIGTAGYFYGNMLKIYEGERAIEGLAAHATYPGLVPQTNNQFRGLDRYKVGGTDLLLNTNALALEIAQGDQTAGVVLEELLLRVKSAETVFSRHDRTRMTEGVNMKGFENVWTFFEPWSDEGES